MEKNPAKLDKQLNILYFYLLKMEKFPMNDIAKAILFVRHDRFPDMSEGKFRQNILKIDHKTWEKIKRLGFARQDTKDKVRDRLKEACPDLDTSFFDYSGKEPLNMPRGSSGLEEPKQDYKSSPEGGSAYLTLVTAVRKHLAGLDPEEMSTMEQAAMNYISEIYREHKSRKKALEAAEAIALEMDGLDMAFAEDSEIIRREKKLKEMC